MTELATVIGSFGSVDDMNALAFSPAGTLYGAGENGTLYKIDTKTGALTNVGNYGAFYGSEGDLVFDNQGHLFASLFTQAESGSTLATVDPGTGQATPIGSESDSHINGLYFVGQTLYGVSAGSPQCNMSTGALLTFNTTTGEPKFKRCLSFNALGASSVPQAATSTSTNRIQRIISNLQQRWDNLANIYSGVHAWWQSTYNRLQERVHSFLQTAENGFFSVIFGHPH
jgi:hypothetical protein